MKNTPKNATRTTLSLSIGATRDAFPKLQYPKVAEPRCTRAKAGQREEQIGPRGNRTQRLKLPCAEIAMPDADCFTFSEDDGLVERTVDLGRPVGRGDLLARVHPADRLGGKPRSSSARMGGILAARHFPGLVTSATAWRSSRRKSSLRQLRRAAGRAYHIASTLVAASHETVCLAGWRGASEGVGNLRPLGPEPSSRACVCLPTRSARHPRWVDAICDVPDAGSEHDADDGLVRALPGLRSLRRRFRPRRSRSTSSWCSPSTCRAPWIGGEQDLQKEGYLAGLQHPEVLAAIRSGFLGRIAVTYVEWAGPHSQATIEAWTVIDGPETGRGLRRRRSRRSRYRASTAPRSRARSTIRRRRSSTATAFAPTRQVIDVSGDGPNNMGVPVLEARERCSSAASPSTACRSC